MLATYDAWLAREPEVYEEPPPLVDPRDEAYSEACEEIDKLKKIIKRLEREGHVQPVATETPRICRLRFDGHIMKQPTQDFSARMRLTQLYPKTCAPSFYGLAVPGY
jgi:hypothetical protein